MQLRHRPTRRVFRAELRPEIGSDFGREVRLVVHGFGDSRAWPAGYPLWAFESADWQLVEADDAERRRLWRAGYRIGEARQSRRRISSTICGSP